MRLLVLGATGSVGRLTVQEARKREHEVTALVRSPQKLRELEPDVRMVPGDALDRNAVGTAVAAQDAVIYVLGAGNVRQTSLFSESTRILLGEMARHSVRRLVCVTGVGAGETKGHGGFLYDRIVYTLFTRGIYADKERQEELIRSSETDWTIVRPAPFSGHKSVGPLRVITIVGDVTLRRISRMEVAHFLVDELEQHRHIRQAVFIGHE